MSHSITVLVVNPGSTSTKLAIFRDGRIVDSTKIDHTSRSLGQFESVWDQFPYRLQCCRDWAVSHLRECSAVAAVGGLLRSVPGGVFSISARMIADARANFQGEHASNLGCGIAFELGSLYRVPAYVVDPVSVDEFECLARFSGHPAIERRSLSHALNIHAAARRASEELQVPLDHSSFVVGHLGGGISVAPVRAGRIIDVNDAASDGPFSPERTGGLPLQPFISLCVSGKYTEVQLRTLVMGKGGLVAYLGTNSTEEVEKRIRAGDETALEVFQAMAYQIAKEIGAMTVVLKGRVDAVVLTGGSAHSSMLTSWIEERVRFLAPVKIYPGEDEMKSLADGVHRVIRGEEQVKEY